MPMGPNPHTATRFSQPSCPALRPALTRAPARRSAPGPTEKWGRYVDATALAYFKDAEDDYEVRFHADRVRYRPAPALRIRTCRARRLTRHGAWRAHPCGARARLRAGAGPSPTTVRNRRFEAMQRLLREGEYFSMEAMQARQPALYSEYIGQYERDDNDDDGEADEEEGEDEEEEGEGEGEEEEGVGRGDAARLSAKPAPQRRVAPPSATRPGPRPATGMERHRDEKLSELVLRRYDQARLQRLAAGGGDDDGDGGGDGFEEEFDTDDDEARAAAAKRRRGNAAAARMAVGRGDPVGPPLRAADLADLREEYVALMQHRFLAGNDVSRG